MTQYLNDSFSVAMGGSEQYRDNWDAIFGNKGSLTGTDSSNEPAVVSLDVYQTLASQFVKNEGSLKAVMEQVLGLNGEVGEVTELFKKYMFHGKDLDMVRLTEELGDVLWYVANLADSYGINMSELASKNIAKLSARYPQCAQTSSTTTSPITETSPESPEK